MSDTEKARLVAWSTQLRQVHQRLRDALELARTSLDEGDLTAGADLLVYCRGFCTALSRHHLGEDAALFPAIVAAHPELAGTIAHLQQDHSMIEHLLRGLAKALDSDVDVTTIHGHLDGIGAIMESHFGYEERQLLSVLETLRLEVDVSTVLGPL